MTAVRVLLNRFLSLFRKPNLERELEEELRFHLDREIQSNVETGMSPAEARHAALRKFGGVDRTKETYRDARGIPWIETVLQDLRYALRTLRKNPGFATVAVLSLALGIGANCAVFTLYNAVLIKDLPVRDPERVARVVASLRGEPRDPSYPAFRQMAARQRVFTEVSATGNVGLNHVTFNGSELQELNEINGQLVSANYFSMLGVPAETGRVFMASDSTAPGEGQVAVLGYGFWQRHLGGDPSVVGQIINLNGVPFTIVGVAPREFLHDRMDGRADIWMPILMQPRLMPPRPQSLLDSTGATWFRMLGRLKPGVTEQQANAELTLLFQQIMAEEIAGGTNDFLYKRPQPSEYRVEIMKGVAVRNPARQRQLPAFLILLGVAAVVLLIACCNVANLLLARGAARREEIGLRLAIGSSRGRLVAQLLTESLLLSAAGGALGFAVAYLGAGVLAGVSAGILPATLDFQPDARVLSFAAVLTLLTSLLFGLIPALQITSGNIDPALRSSARSQGATRTRQRTSRVLVTAQVALSLWLLIGAGLLIRTLQNLREMDIGMDRQNVTTINLALERSVRPAEFEDLRRTVLSRVQSIPAVRSAGLSLLGPYSTGSTSGPVRVPGANIDPAKDPEVRKSWVTSGYFETVGTHVILGRGFTDRDSAAAPKVAIINQALARHYFGEANPQGQRVYFARTDAQYRYIPFSTALDKEESVEIVGIARDVWDRDLRRPPARMLYLPLAQGTDFGATLYVRTSGDSKAAVGQIRSVLKEFSASFAPRTISSIEEIIDGRLTAERLLAKILTIFGGLALALAAIGLYGVMSYAVARRTGEIGVRMALGARSAQVLTMVLRETFLLVLIGIALGIPAALATTRFLASLLFGLSPTDPTTIVVLSAAMLAVAILAGYVPARRAARVDPLVALRHE